MIGLLLIAALAIGMWAWKTRDQQALRFGDVAAVMAAMLALRLFTRHDFALALLAAGGAGWWYWFRRREPAAGGDGAAMSAEEARRVLDLDRDADGAAIRAAHRRLIARVHPDAGGSADLTAQVNIARDVLLRRG